MRRVRTLIVDDSATMRAVLRGMLDADREIEVVGAARDAMEARTMIKELNPDVLTLDLEMPGMSGLDFLDKIMTLRPMPVVIVSAQTSKGAETTMRALQMGAFDCVGKPELNLQEDGSSAVDELCAVVKAAARSNSKAHVAPALTSHVHASRPTFAHKAGGAELIAIGASTGGVEALSLVMADWPEDCPPTFVVQHISGSFSDALARRLDSVCAANVQIAETDTFAQPGNVYVAPGGARHLVVSNQSRLTCRLKEADPISGHRPSVDALFGSVAQVMPGKAIGILLTGMGQDGARGLLKIRQTGSRTIAQDKATSVVHGMPGAAIDLGAAEFVMPLNKVAEKALALCSQ